MIRPGEGKERQGRGDGEWWNRGVEIFNCMVREEKGSLRRCYLGKYLKAVKVVNDRDIWAKSSNMKQRQTRRPGYVWMCLLGS